jgi:hypothetical protein
MNIHQDEKLWIFSVWNAIQVQRGLGLRGKTSPVPPMLPRLVSGKNPERTQIPKTSLPGEWVRPGLDWLDSKTFPGPLMRCVALMIAMKPEIYLLAYYLLKNMWRAFPVRFQSIMLFVINTLLCFAVCEHALRSRLSFSCQSELSSMECRWCISPWPCSFRLKRFAFTVCGQATNY